MTLSIGRLGAHLQTLVGSHRAILEDALDGRDVDAFALRWAAAGCAIAAEMAGGAVRITPEIVQAQRVEEDARFPGIPPSEVRRLPKDGDVVGASGPPGAHVRGPGGEPERFEPAPAVEVVEPAKVPDKPSETPHEVEARLYRIKLRNLTNTLALPDAKWRATVGSLSDEKAIDALRNANKSVWLDGCQERHPDIWQEVEAVFARGRVVS